LRELLLAGPCLAAYADERKKNQKLFESKKTYTEMGARVKIGIRFVAVASVIWWFIIVSHPIQAYNTTNESDETALPPNIPALASTFQANFSQEIGQNYSGYIAETPQNPAEGGAITSGTIGYTHPPYQSQLWIVDYRGEPYPCGAKCVFLNDAARMVAVPCTSGFLKFYEKYPDQNVVQSLPFPVDANIGYNSWFFGDVEGLHTLWFTIEDYYGQVARSNDVTFRVLIENCSPMSNCSPSFPYV